MPERPDTVPNSRQPLRRRSVTHEFAHKRRPVGIGAPDEQNIVSGSIAGLHRRRK